MMKSHSDYIGWATAQMSHYFTQPLLHWPTDLNEFYFLITEILIVSDKIALQIFPPADIIQGIDNYYSRCPKYLKVSR